jgi:hypothetical protein
MNLRKSLPDWLLFIGLVCMYGAGTCQGAVISVCLILAGVGSTALGSAILTAVDDDNDDDDDREATAR